MITPDSITSPDPSKYVGKTDALLAVLSTVQESIYIYDPHSHTSVYTNQSILHLLGYDQSQIEALGADWTKQIVHAADLPYLTKHLSNLSRLAPGKRSRVAHRAKAADGAWQYVESSGVMLTSSNGEPAQVIGCTRLIDQTAVVPDTTMHDHRCTNCAKLLGKEKVNDAVVEVKCGRCGEVNGISLE